MKNKEALIPKEMIERRILFLRGKKVMLDKDLGTLYGVKPIRLREQVKRNLERFPPDFMFQLSPAEIQSMVSQNAIPSVKHLGGHRPYEFTEQGVAMLSSVLKSRRAIQVNIQIMRAFSKIRHMLETHTKLKKKIEEMERKYDGQFRIVFDALRELLAPPAPKPKGPIGFQP